jgi:hypothetical protein
MIRGPNREQGETVEPLGFLGIAGRTGIKIGNVTTEVDFVIGRVQNRKWVDTAFASENPLPQRWNI